MGFVIGSTICIVGEYMALVCLVLGAGLYQPLPASAIQTATTPQDASVSATLQPSPAPVANIVSGPSRTAAPQEPAPTAPAAAPSSCTTAPYAAPTGLGLYSLPSGLTARVDAPSYYHVGSGGTVSSIHRDLALCAARQPALGGYHGITAYAYNWTYYSVQADDGLCTLGDLKVAIHIQQLLPDIRISDITSAADSDVIAGEITRLIAHESGHVALDSSHAAELYRSLSGLHESCATIIATANTVAEASATNLAALNQTLDDATAHGIR